jgi:hypothetical protein
MGVREPDPAVGVLYFDEIGLESLEGPIRKAIRAMKRQSEPPQAKSANGRH